LTGANTTGWINGEQALAKLKALLRKAEERTLEALRRRIGSLLDAFSPPSAPTTSGTVATVPGKSEMLWLRAVPHTWQRLRSAGARRHIIVSLNSLLPM
jgi:hypothetical protein